jgi:hypothetical protein
MITISGIAYIAARITDNGRLHSRHRPDQFFNTPETTPGKYGFLNTHIFQFRSVAKLQKAELRNIEISNTLC